MEIYHQCLDEGKDELRHVEFFVKLSWLFQSIRFNPNGLSTTNETHWLLGVIRVEVNFIAFPLKAMSIAWQINFKTSLKTIKIKILQKSVF